MPEAEKREKVMLLTQELRVLGEMRLGPDGAIWDFKHGGTSEFVTVYDVQCFRKSDGKRVYDAVRAEFGRRAVTAVFRQSEIAFLRKDTA